MKTGLVLVVLGHVSFIAAALLHGTVLRYVAGPHDAVALQYLVTNILSVTSAIMVRPGRERAGARECRGLERSLMSPRPDPGVSKESAPRPLLCPLPTGPVSQPLSLPQLPSLEQGAGHSVHLRGSR